MIRRSGQVRQKRFTRVLDPRLSIAGIVCVIGAIVAGGVEALGVQIPAIGSLVRQILLATLGLVLVGASAFTTTRENPPEEMAMSTDRVPLPASTPRPKLSPRFTGREELLAQTRTALMEYRRVALAGLGGVGKTQLALAYVERFRPQYETVWWIRAEDEVALNEDYVALAAAQGISVDAQAEQTQQIEQIRRWLDDRDGWLLVFDNAEAEEIVETYLPQRRSGQALVTTRNQHWRAVEARPSRPRPPTRSGCRRAVCGVCGCGFLTARRQARTARPASHLGHGGPTGGRHGAGSVRRGCVLVGQFRVGFVDPR
jgi:NB-ARC domain